MKCIILLCLALLIFTSMSGQSNNTLSNPFQIEQCDSCTAPRLTNLDLHQIFLMIHVFAMAMLIYREIILSDMPMVLAANP
jgi:hypothetical protein